MIAPATLVLAFIASVYAQAQINTPASLIQCQPALINWNGGTAPYFLSVLPGGQSSGTPLKQFDQTSATSLTWTVDLASGTAITLQIRDSTGATNFSDQVTIGAGVSSACLNSGSTASTVAASSTAAILSSLSSQSAASSSTAMSSSSAASSSSMASMTSSQGRVSSIASSAAAVTSSAGAAASSAAAAPASGATMNQVGKAVSGLAAVALGAFLI